MYNKEEAQERINQLQAEGKPFVFIINFECTQAFVEATTDIDSNEMMCAFPRFSNVPHQARAGVEPLRWCAKPSRRADYEQSINLVKRNIMAGNSYLANLTCKIPIETNLGLRDIFLRSKARYRCWVKDMLVCFSPETFVRVDHDTISSYPMKGTCDATLPHAREDLMASAKEAAEHATIVDLIRNDLSQVADSVQVARYRYIERVRTHRGELLQTSSEITGRLSHYYRDHVGDLIFKLLPAGSITGAPKAKTVEILREAENYDRGFYTGVIGHYADGVMDSAVMIRFVDNEHGHLYYKAGGGITAQSDNDDEYQEVIDKVYVPIY